MSRARLLSEIPWNEVLDLADTLLEEGVEKADAAEAIAAMLDSLIDWNAIAPGVVGAALEVIDGPVFQAAIELTLAFASDPERRAARIARRDERRAERKARRAARRAERS